MAETASRPRSARSARDGDTNLAPLRIHYFRRMKPNRVYPWTVSWPSAAKADQDLTLRLLIAGAQVVPAEQTLRAGDSKAQVVFHVTPIAKGWLKGQRLEVLAGGRKIQEIPLASKVISQRRTLVLFFLAFFVPFIIWNYFHFTLIQFRPADHKNRTDTFIDTPNVIKKTDEMVANFKDVADPPRAVKDILPQAVKDTLDDHTHRVVVSFYIEICKSLREYKAGFYLGLLFFILALFSWFFSRQVSKTAQGRPLPLGQGSSRAADDD